MEPEVRMLEDLVEKAVSRISELSEERDRLRRELAVLRQRLQAGDAMSRRSEDTEKAWRTERRQVISELRDALGELRAE